MKIHPSIKLLLPLLLLSGPVMAAPQGGDHAGIPWGPIGLHALNLFLLLAVLAFFLRGRIATALRSRKAGVAAEIEEANRLRQDARARFDELEGRLAGFEKQLAGMRVEAEQEALREREIILAQAANDIRAVQAAAERMIQAETRRAQQVLRQDAARLAVELAADQIRGQITPEDDQRLATDFFNALPNNGGVTHG